MCKSNFNIFPRRFGPLALGALLVLSAFGAQAQTMAQATASKETLVANQSIAKAQAVGSVVDFMNNGNKICDSNGVCHSGYGADDQLDYSSIAQRMQATTGVMGESFTATDGSGTVSSQTGQLLLSCVTPAVHTVAGVAIKTVSCSSDTTGAATLKFQVCTAPSRGFSVAPPKNAVVCSTDPTDPTYRPPPGSICLIASCDTEPVGTLNGWSATQSATFLSENTTAANGLKLVFYPDLAAGVVGTFSSDSDAMTALKIVGAVADVKSGEIKIAVKVAYRHKQVITKTQLASSSSITNPAQYTAQWTTLEKLQANPELAQYQEKYGANAAGCLTKLQAGLAGDGKIEVCDPDYNHDGVKPVAKTAQVAAAGAACQTTTQCLHELVNNSTWAQTCTADVPLANKNCSTTTEFTMNALKYFQTRNLEVCHERRTTAQYACTTQAVLTGVVPQSCAAGTVLVNKATYIGDYLDPYFLFRVTCQGGNNILVQASTSVGGTEFDDAMIYGTTFWIINETIVQSPFQSVGRNVGTDCQPWVSTNPNYFTISCSGASCTYGLQIGNSGQCPLASFSPNAAQTVNISMNGVFTTLNNCTAYE